MKGYEKQRAGDGKMSLMGLKRKKDERFLKG